MTCGETTGAIEDREHPSHLRSALARVVCASPGIHPDGASLLGDAGGVASIPVCQRLPVAAHDRLARRTSMCPV